VGTVILVSWRRAAALPLLALLVLLGACTSSAAKPLTPNAQKYKDWNTAFQTAELSFEQDSQTLKYVKAADDCNQIRMLQQSGLLFPSVGDGGADAAWQGAMTLLDSAITTCATGANFRDPAALGKAAEDFAAADSDIKVVLEKVGVTSGP